MIKEMLQAVGVTRDDTVLIHSNVTHLANELTNGNLNGASELLYQGLHDNTQGFVVPTFNYDFSTYGFPYVHEDTPSQVGWFTNYCLFHKKLPRTFHPVFSFCVDTLGISWDVSKDAFGKDSVFDYLYLLNAKIVMLSVPATFMTFCHYVEQKLNVWYRYKKYFKGQVSKGGEHWIDTFSLYVRDLEHDVHTNLAPTIDLWESCGIIKRYEINPELYMLSVSCQDLFNAVRCALVQNENAIITYKE